MGQPVTVVAAGGLPVTVSTNGYGLPVTAVASGGLPVTVMASGGLPVVGSGIGGGGPPINGVVFDGDSLTQYGGSVGGGTNVRHSDWFTTITGLPTSNTGVGGRTLQAMDTAFATGAGTLYNAANRNNYIVLGGANNGSDTVPVMWAALSSICAKAKAVGFRVWVCTQLPRSDYPNPVFTDFSDYTRANWTTIADGLVEFFSPQLFTPDAYFIWPSPPDGIHQTVRGSIRMGNQVRSAMGLPYIATDSAPDAFTFTDVTGAATSSPVTSNEIELAGMTAPATFTVSGGTLVVNGVDSGASGTVQPYDMIAARGTSSSAASTAVNVAVTIGGVSDTFTITTAAPVSYTGPGDIATFAGWWSPARAYNTAYAAAGSPIMDLVDQAGAHPITINALANGKANVAAINSWVAANSVTDIFVAKLYDQSGHGLHMTNSVMAPANGARPKLTMSAFNGLPAVLFGSGSSAGDRLDSPAGYNRAQPFSMSAVSIRTGVGSYTSILGVVGSAPNFLYNNAANQVALYGGNVAPVVTASDGALHALQAVFNGASSNITVDGVAGTPADCGGATFTGSSLTMGVFSGGSLQGLICEVGLYSGDFTSSITALNSNQHGSNGYNF